MFKLHILTACSRPENLGKVQESIEEASIPECQAVFHVLFDDKQEHIGGQFLKNKMLDSISDGYVYVLDDDTTMHPKMIKRIFNLYDLLGPKLLNAVVFSQDRKTSTLEASKENMRVAGVDIGQVILKRELIGEKRIPLTYEGDGEFLTDLLKDRDDVIYLSEVLSFYNALRDETADAEPDTEVYTPASVVH